MKINVDLIYPVGSLYFTTNTINPRVLFGGTWEQVKDRFILACGDTYSNGATGGEAEHTLILDEIPSHNHVIPFYKGAGTHGDGLTASGLNQGNGVWFAQSTTTNRGGNKAHNNMPPYLAVYVWKRVS